MAYMVKNKSYRGWGVCLEDIGIFVSETAQNPEAYVMADKPSEAAEKRTDRYGLGMASNRANVQGNT